MPVLTNSTVLSYAVESTPGVLPGTPDFYQLEPNDLTTFGASITTVARNPISQDRMAKKGAITDLDSSVEYDSDLTRASFDNFFDGFVFASWKAQVDEATTAVTASTDAFTHAAITALVAGDLVYTREHTNSENNGLHLVTGTPTTTSTTVTTALVDETPPTGAKMEYAGFQAASGDLVVDADGNITSTVFDFTADTTLYVGAMIYIGDGTSANSFATAGSGTARIRVIAANKLTIDKQSSSTWAADAGTGKTVRVFVGSWIRNVPLTDGDFLNRTYQFETEYAGLDTIDDGYEYAIGNQANQMTLNMPLTDKATVGWSFIGLDQEAATDTQKSGNRHVPYDTDAFNTTSDFARISLTKSSDGTALAAYFKDMTVTINNNVAPEKILGTLGANNMNIGDFLITASTQVLFNSLEVINAVRDNETVSFDWNLENDDGALHFDIPSMTLGNAGKTFPRNETVKIDIDGDAFKDTFFGYVISCTRFPYLPVAG